jgi:2-polyprenyl-6-methoxyphenol hydroxylase-like FAD-dependent oxidoreductase
MTGTVIVVGAGPAGLVVASELALAGVPVKIVERRTSGVQSRAGTILPRVLELLQTRGLAQRFIDRAREILPQPLFRTHMWGGMKPVEWRHLDSRFGYRLILPQNVTEEILTEHALAAGVVIERGVTVDRVTQDASGVEIGTIGADGKRSTQRCSYLVGCDGGRSAVRRELGIGFDGHGPTFTGIVADVKMANPWPGGRHITDNDRGWLASFPFGAGITRFNLVHAERMRADPGEPVTVEEVRRCLTEILEEEPGFDELVWGSRYTDTTRIASAFSRGRAFLAGESTRIHYPASGVGMNFCIQDAFNLGWKLAAVVNDHASPDLLDTFEAERRPVAEGLLRSVAAQVGVQFAFSPDAVAFKRWFESTVMPVPDVNRKLALELNGLSEPYPGPDGSGPLIGRPVPDLEIQFTDHIGTISELLRAGRFVLLDLTGGAALRGLVSDDVPVEVVSGIPIRPDNRVGETAVLLVRPDGYVAWSGPDAQDRASAELAIRQWLTTTPERTHE